MTGTPKQKTALERLTDSITKIIIYGGAAGGGKSFLGCFWLLIMCQAYPGSRWFIGREELKRIRQSTLITWAKVCKALGFNDYIINGQDNFIRLGNGSQIDLLDLRYLPSDELYERYGSIEYTGGWIEEAGEINFGAFDTLMTRIGRHLNAEFGLMPKMLVTCNPKKNWLYQEYYKPFKEGNMPDNVAFIQAFVTDNPFITSDYIDNLKNTKDKAKKERLLYGNWEYDDDPAALMDYDSICAIFKSSHVQGGKRYITADIARYGRDRTVISVWDGFRVIKIIEIAKSGLDAVADRMRELMAAYDIPLTHVIVDEDGVGGGVVDFLGCKGFVNNSRAISNNLTPENYDNLKSQCYFLLAKEVMDGHIYIDCQDTKIKTYIIEELEQVKQKDVDTDGKRGILPKDKVKEVLGRSPDYSDNLMMRMWFTLAPDLTGINWVW